MPYILTVRISPVVLREAKLTSVVAQQEQATGYRRLLFPLTLAVRAMSMRAAVDSLRHRLRRSEGISHISHAMQKTRERKEKNVLHTCCAEIQARAARVSLVRRVLSTPRLRAKTAVRGVHHDVGSSLPKRPPCGGAVRPAAGLSVWGLDTLLGRRWFEVG